MKTKTLKLLLTLITSHFSLIVFSAVPLRWTVETSRLQPAVFDVVRGETLSLEASFQSYGTPVSTSNMTAFLCWQTNGMSSAWWTTNACTAAALSGRPSNVASVLFTPDMDPGAPVVNAFLGLSDSTNQLPTTSYQLPSLSYRAAFTLRFRNGPGATPNVIDHPIPILDLAHTVVINPPWPTQGDFAATTTVMKAELKTYVDEHISGAGLVTPTEVTNISSRVTSNVVTKAYVESLGISAGLTTNAAVSIAANQVTNDVAPWALSGNAKQSTDLTPSTNYTDACCSTLAVCSTNISYKAITNEVTSGYLCTVAAAQAMKNGCLEKIKQLGNEEFTFSWNNQYLEYSYNGIVVSKFSPAGFASNIMNVGMWSNLYSIGDNENMETALSKKANTSDVYTKTQSDSTFASKATEATVSEWETYWRGDRVRLSVTNYYGNTSGESPRLRIEEFDHSTTNGTVVSNFYHVVWDEIDRQTNYMAQTDAKVNNISNAVMYAAWRQTNLQLVNKAPRAWQSVTSAGEDAPPNMVWHTAPQSVFAGGTEYAHVAVGEGTICVLTDKGAPVYTDGAEGQFRFQDQSGQNYFGFDVRSSYKIGCRTDGISVNSQQHIVSLTYDLTSATNPSILHSTNLVDWADAVVEWEQNPPEGTKVCYINCGNDPKGFYQAEIRYAGGSKFLTNMQADLMGGIAASNQTLNFIQSVEPYIISNQVMWRVKQ